eukprot:3609730-Amphidinium_carterae.2
MAGSVAPFLATLALQAGRSVIGQECVPDFSLPLTQWALLRAHCVVARWESLAAQAGRPLVMRRTTQEKGRAE